MSYRARIERSGRRVAFQGVASADDHEASRGKSAFILTSAPGFVLMRSQKAIGPATTNILSLVVPLIEESLSSPAKEYFEADGLTL
jgi:hypothetical protein